VIIRRYGTMDIDKIRGLWHAHKPTAIATGLAILGIMGAPFFNGSVSKYFMMREASEPLEWAIIILNLGTILIFLKYAAIFFGQPEEGMVRKIKTDWCKLTAIMFFGIASFILGVFGEQFKNFVFNLEVHVEALSYLEKIGVFAISLVVGIVFTKYIPKDAKFFTRIREMDLGFRGICASLGVFFAIILVFVGFLR